MKEKLYMGIDLGTSFIKAAVYDLNGTKMAFHSEPVRDERPKPGMFIQHGEALYQSVLNCVSKITGQLSDRAGDICAIAFTGQMAGCIGVDEKWEDVTTWSCSLDTRYMQYSSRQLEQFGEDFFNICGTNAPVMSAKYEWFAKEFPQEASQIAKYVMLNGYVIGKLSGIPVGEAAIDYSLITWTGFADIRKLSWSEKLCKEIGIDKQLLPLIRECTAIGGYLGAAAAEKTGLSVGIPLVLGAGDKVCGCIGAAVCQSGDMIFEASSYGAISLRVDEVRLDRNRNYDVIGSESSREFYAHKYIQGSGISIDWFVKEFCNQSREGISPFKQAEQLAANIQPGSEKMLSLGLYSGSAMPFDASLRGLFMGHTWAHHTGHFYHSLLEGFSYDLAITLDALQEQYPEYEKRTIKLIGGGAKSAIWPQMLSDVTGYNFAILDRDDTALWGAALLTVKGAGDVQDIYTVAENCVKEQKWYKTNQANYKKYRPYVRFYEKMRREMHGYFEELNQL